MFDTLNSGNVSVPIILGAQNMCLLLYRLTWLYNFQDCGIRIGFFFELTTFRIDISYSLICYIVPLISLIVGCFILSQLPPAPKNDTQPKTRNGRPCNIPHLSMQQLTMIGHEFLTE